MEDLQSREYLEYYRKKLEGYVQNKYVPVDAVKSNLEAAVQKLSKFTFSANLLINTGIYKLIRTISKSDPESPVVPLYNKWKIHLLASEKGEQKHLDKHKNISVQETQNIKTEENSHARHQNVVNSYDKKVNKNGPLLSESFNHKFADNRKNINEIQSTKLLDNKLGNDVNNVDKFKPTLGHKLDEVKNDDANYIRAPNHFYSDKRDSLESFNSTFSNLNDVSDLFFQSDSLQSTKDSQSPQSSQSYRLPVDSSGSEHSQPLIKNQYKDTETNSNDAINYDALAVQPVSVSENNNYNAGAKEPVASPYKREPYGILLREGMFYVKPFAWSLDDTFVRVREMYRNGHYKYSNSKTELEDSPNAKLKKSNKRLRTPDKTDSPKKIKLDVKAKCPEKTDSPKKMKVDVKPKCPEKTDSPKKPKSDAKAKCPEKTDSPKKLKLDVKAKCSSDIKHSSSAVIKETNSSGKFKEDSNSSNSKKYSPAQTKTKNLNSSSSSIDKTSKRASTPTKSGIKSKMKDSKAKVSEKFRNLSVDQTCTEKSKKKDHLNLPSSVCDIKRDTPCLKSCDGKIVNNVLPIDIPIKCKKDRTSVYPGKRNSEVASLRNSCIRVLKKNIDCIKSKTMPYKDWRPILVQCTPTQLRKVEENNPHLQKFTDELWKSHCQMFHREYKPEPTQTWRQLFMKAQVEHNKKLKNIAANISASLSKNTPERQTKLAVIEPVERSKGKKPKFAVVESSESSVKTSPMDSSSSHKKTKKGPFPPLMTKVRKTFEYMSKHKK